MIKGAFMKNPFLMGAATLLALGLLTLRLNGIVPPASRRGGP